jgi:hypothetical protein
MCLPIVAEKVGRIRDNPGRRIVPDLAFADMA